MENALIDLLIFTTKSLVVFITVLILLIAFFALLARGKAKPKAQLVIKNLNEEYDDVTENILEKTLTKKEFKKFLKGKKETEKACKADAPQPKVYVLHFNGDIKASAVANLSEEITAILTVATPKDEVFMKLESPGGVVHGYGLAAAQLMRIREKGIRLIVSVDKVAASGGYMMACVAHHILAAPYAIVGSIGVIVQLPNFHRLLKDKHIDFEQHTAGEYKRTLTVFGENTADGREKLQEEIEKAHELFKNLIQTHRPQIDIQQVSTGEHWFGLQALPLKLVDEIKTSDDYLLARKKEAKLYHIYYETKKPLLSKLTSAAKQCLSHFIGFTTS
ncbi:MAG TPA: protease SohB [Gammaproteobacteria bacterium]|jgi:serine protease SohB|nr:protease SohB [Gammaproteobacteria bacterium]